jgi:hypothetical protein
MDKLQILHELRSVSVPRSRLARLRSYHRFVSKYIHVVPAVDRDWLHKSAAIHFRV